MAPPKPSTALEALRRNALRFRNLTRYRWRSLQHSGALHTLVNAFRIPKSPFIEQSTEVERTWATREIDDLAIPNLPVPAHSAQVRSTPNARPSVLVKRRTNLPNCTLILVLDCTIRCPRNGVAGVTYGAVDRDREASTMTQTH
jgi:hypothetical protein